MELKNTHCCKIHVQYILSQSFRPSASCRWKPCSCLRVVSVAKTRSPGNNLNQYAIKQAIYIMKTLEEHCYVFVRCYVWLPRTTATEWWKPGIRHTYVNGVSDLGSSVATLPNTNSWLRHMYVTYRLK